jgi:glutamate synthase (NADPH/NADH) small chain
MGKTGGFLEHKRQANRYRPVAERIGDFRAVELPFAQDILSAQMARCLECGTPFCHGYGCPLGNVIPELHELAWQDRWEEALALLLASNPFPEFTGRLCPALCEAACVLAVNDEAVTIRQIELAIVEEGFARGYLPPAPPARRLEKKVAVVGSGPAGLAVAEALNKAGCQVVVFERAAKCGGLLRYGIPDFKLEKWVLDRRLRLMEQEGVRFETGVEVGKDLTGHYLQSRFDAVGLCGGAEQPRDLQVPGRELAGIHFALDFLSAQNRRNAGEPAPAAEDLDARGKQVAIVGGGDTGADCLGTALRQGAAGVTQLEILSEPPAIRPATTPWPMWPTIRRDSSSHAEGGRRRWAATATGFVGKNGRVVALEGVEVEWLRQADGTMKSQPRPGTEFSLSADLVLLAMGYLAGGRQPLAAHFQLACDQAGRILTNDLHQTSVPGVFVAGDLRGGQSLVCRAIADGLAAARAIRESFYCSVCHPERSEGSQSC